MTEVTEFENAFSKPRKVMDFRKMAEVTEKSWNFIFWSKYFMLVEIYAPKPLGFQYFSLRKCTLVIEKSLNFITQFLCEPCNTSSSFYLILISHDNMASEKVQNFSKTSFFRSTIIVIRIVFGCR